MQGRNVSLGHLQRLELRQFPVVAERRHDVPQTVEGVVQTVHPPSFAGVRRQPALLHHLDAGLRRRRPFLTVFLVLTVEGVAVVVLRIVGAHAAAAAHPLRLVLVVVLVVQVVVLAVVVLGAPGGVVRRVGLRRHAWIGGRRQWTGHGQCVMAVGRRHSWRQTSIRTSLV